MTWFRRDEGGRITYHQDPASAGLDARGMEELADDHPDVMAMLRAARGDDQMAEAERERAAVLAKLGITDAEAEALMRPPQRARR